MERSFIRWLRERIPAHPQAPLGIGDDAALLQFSVGKQVVATTDMLMDGVDFVLADCDPRRVGRKALAVNLSDLAAMAATPVAAFVSLALPRQGGQLLAQQLYEGLLPLAAEFQIALAGGDTNSWDAPLAISITALGEVTPGQEFSRAGARPGDWILVTGSFGGSILGKHFDFTPRLREALWLAAHAEIHAAIDVSDGLSLDLFRLAEESGCGAAISPEHVPLDPAAVTLAQQRADGVSPLQHALADGEDFELILAAPPASAAQLIATQPLAAGITKIGEFVAQPGLWRIGAGGELIPLAAQGYEHGFRE